MRAGAAGPSGRGLKNLSNWRSVRLWETQVEQHLRRRHWLWLHGLCIGTLVLSVMAVMAHAQMRMGIESLALRYLLNLGVGYLVYLLVLRLWAAALIRSNSEAQSLDGDLPLEPINVPPDWHTSPANLPGFRSGQGGDFSGGGATGDFSGSAVVNAGETSDGFGGFAGGALDAAAGADEGAIVVVPVVAVFLIDCAIVFGAGSLMLLYFGWEALLAVAVELAFSYVSARTAIRVAREGWLSAAIRLTWKPLLGAVFCAVSLGAVIDYFVPDAQSLPHAIKLIRQSRSMAGN